MTPEPGAPGGQPLDFLGRLSPLGDPVSRRNFLKVMGASMALAGLGGCVPLPAKQIVPYVRPPTEARPAQPRFYATAMTLSGVATGLLVQSREGRPIKVEGNPSHPGSLGATDTLAQASVLGLYDPGRSQTVIGAGRVQTWTDFLRMFRNVVAGHRLDQGAGLRFLTETVTSPTLGSQMNALLAAFPAAKWHQYEPVNRDNARAGAIAAFGRDAQPIYHMDQADLVLSLDADVLTSEPGWVRYARDFTARRRAEGNQQAMNRLYVVESTMTPTGAVADHHLPLRYSLIEALAQAVAAAVGVGVPIGATLAGVPDGWIAALARDLQTHRGTSLVVAGLQQPPAVHALAHAMNQALGNAGRTVTYVSPIEANPVDQGASLADLVADVDAGAVQTLLILGGNPVYTAPTDQALGDHLGQVPLVVHLSLYEDETSAASDWHIPQTHYLEEWSDARAYDGTVSVVQPLIEPLYGGKSVHELIAVFTDQPETPGHDIVKGYWQGQQASGDFDAFWRTTLSEGVVAGTASQPLTVTAAGYSPPPLAQQLSLPQGEGVDLVFRHDSNVYDGRFTNNTWLLELPRPITTLTWDNVAMMSRAMADRLQVVDGDVVELRVGGRSVRAPALAVPGHPDDSVTVTLGYGREHAGPVGNGVGFNAYALRTAATAWAASGAEVVKTADQHVLAMTGGHHRMEGRDVVRATTLQQFQQDPQFAHSGEKRPPGTVSLYPDYQYHGYRWGMAIDLSACVGCNACIVACQAENNIPTVGKFEVQRGREMYWLRVDRYNTGEEASPATHFQPVPCMQCENAPCEYVCPPGATVHSDEGLNDMVYNRCIGTRYCSNNCPYKVRRFNFFQYADYDTESLKALYNPDVTVRERGVMEKCSYCIQRITAGRILSEERGERLRDGEVVTACQAACPTRTIVFGDLNDPNSRVSQLKALPLNYELLGELNTRPRTTYLAGLRNPNPEIPGENA